MADQVVVIVKLQEGTLSFDALALFQLWNDIHVAHLKILLFNKPVLYVQV